MPPIPISFDVEEPDKVTTVGELKEKFYKVCTLLKKEMWKRARKKDKITRILHPQVLIINPPGYTADLSDVYVALYYRGYYVRVEHGRSIFGPHKFELYYQVKTGQRVWLGTHIRKFNFFSEKDLRRILREEILEEAYYCSPSSAEDIVELPIETTATIDTRHGGPKQSAEEAGSSSKSSKPKSILSPFRNARPPN